MNNWEKEYFLWEEKEMWNFDYSHLKDRTWDNEILSYIAKIHEFKGKQELYFRQKPVELERLVEIAKVQSTESSESMLKCQMTIRQASMIIRVIHILRNHCRKGCINCKMEQWYKEIYIHHSFCTALI